MTSSGKVRIYELSKDLGLENKDVLDAAEKLSIAARSHSSSISDTEAGKIRNLLKQGGSAVASAPAKPAPGKAILSVKKASSPAAPSMPSKPVAPAAAKPSPKPSAPSRPGAPLPQIVQQPVSRQAAPQKPVSRPSAPRSGRASTFCSSTVCNNTICAYTTAQACGSALSSKAFSSRFYRFCSISSCKAHLGQTCTCSCKANRHLTSEASWQRSQQPPAYRSAITSATESASEPRGAAATRTQTRTRRQATAQAGCSWCPRTSNRTTPWCESSAKRASRPALQHAATPCRRSTSRGPNTSWRCSL